MFRANLGSDFFPYESLSYLMLTELKMCPRNVRVITIGSKMSHQCQGERCNGPGRSVSLGDRGRNRWVASTFPGASRYGVSVIVSVHEPFARQGFEALEPAIAFAVSPDSQVDRSYAKGLAGGTLDWTVPAMTD